jgi:hypothetical protein
MSRKYNYSSTAISTIHKSPQHPLSLFQPAVSSLAIPWQQLLTVLILQLHVLRFDLHCLLSTTLVNQTIVPSLLSLPCRTQLSTKLQSLLCRTQLDHPNCLPYNPFAWTKYKTPFPTAILLLCAYSLPWELVYRCAA